MQRYGDVAGDGQGGGGRGGRQGAMAESFNFVTVFTAPLFDGRKRQASAALLHRKEDNAMFRVIVALFLGLYGALGACS